MHKPTEPGGIPPVSQILIFQSALPIPNENLITDPFGRQDIFGKFHLFTHKSAVLFQNALKIFA
jgi:hypothetical protein